MFDVNSIIVLLLIFLAGTVWDMRKTINELHLMVQDLWVKKATLGEQDEMGERIIERNKL